MKFGRYIQKQTLSEWARHYMNYKGLKKIIKAARKSREAASVQAQRDQFFSVLDAELDKVSRFYVKKEEEAKARLAFLRATKELPGCKGEVLEDLYEALVVFQSQLINLQNFVEVNGTGFRKILKKFDRHLKASTKEMYLQSHVEVAPWYNKDILAELADTVAALMGELYQVLRAEKQEGVYSYAQFGVRQVESELQRVVAADDASGMAVLYDRQAAHESTTRSDAAVPFAHRALRRCCEMRAVQCAELLLSRVDEASAGSVNKVTGRNAAHMAAVAGSERILVMLASKGVDLDLPDMCGRRPLHYVSKGGFSDCATFLLSRNASVSQTDHDGQTPLVSAIQSNHLATVQVFLSHLASVGAPLPAGLLLLACKEGHADIANALIGAGANPNETNADDLTPLHLACQAGHTACCEVLLRAGAHHTLCDKENQWTPLFFAANEGHLGCARLLLSAGAQVDAVDDSGWTPFLHALYAGHMEAAALMRCSPELAAARAVRTSPPSPLVGSLKPADAPPAQPTQQHAAMDVLDLDGIPSLALPPPILPTKVYGHQSLKENAQLHIRLGGAGQPPLTLVPERRLASMKLIMRTMTGIVESVVLPMEDDTETFVLSLPSLDNFSLQFDLLPTFGSQLIGRAAALPAAFAFAASSASRGTIVCPVFDTYLQVIGELCFDFVLISPYSQVGRTPPNPHAPTYWKSTVAPPTPPERGGPAGAASLVLSSSLAQEYVVLPVQMTRDAHVVVHDVRGMLDLPFQLSVGDLAFAEVMRLRPPTVYEAMFGKVGGVAAQRTVSLHEALSLLPAGVGACVELLSPPSSAAFDPNAVIDTLLDVTYAAAGTRSLMFCADEPHLCLTLNLKQANYPVFFRTRAGMERRSTDARCNSLHQAVRFAKSANLLGIFCDATPLGWAPALAAVVKEAGVVLGTFGAANDDAATVQVQERAGVDVVQIGAKLHVRR